ncbi:MAG: hypothetical protein ACW981_02680 [Candidatus Hodarchaeales archaeon]
MLERAIDQISEQNLIKNENDWMFVKNVYHIIETAEFYNGDSPKDFPWGKRANIDFEERNNDNVNNIKYSLLSKIFLKSYLFEIKEKVEKKLNMIEERDILLQDPFSGGNEQTTFDKYLYLLRHNMHHIGELNKALRDNKEKRIDWI